jgi:hypothetical protein
MFNKQVTKGRKDHERTYVRIALDHDTVRVTDISVVNPKKEAARPVGASKAWDPLSGFGMLGGPGNADTESSTVAQTVNKFDTKDGLLYAEGADARGQRHNMYLEPLNLVIEVPSEGPGARTYLMNTSGSRRVTEACTMPSSETSQ